MGGQAVGLEGAAAVGHGGGDAAAQLGAQAVGLEGAAAVGHGGGDAAAQLGAQAVGLEGAAALGHGGGDAAAQLEAQAVGLEGAAAVGHGGGDAATQVAAAQLGAQAVIGLQGAFDGMRKTRGRPPKPGGWQKTSAKNARLSGKALEYTVKKGGQEVVKKIEPKAPIPVNCKCKFKCTKFTDQQRKDVCSAYYDLADYVRQREFIVRCVKKKKVRNHKEVDEDDDDAPGRVRPDKAVSYQYYLPLTEVIGERRDYRVCRQFFLGTLGGISKVVVHNAMKYRTPQGTYRHKDMRGAHTKGKFTRDELNFVRQHIRSFPALPSHYSRADSTQLYLDAELNLRKMFDAYKTSVAGSPELRAVKYTTYKQYFYSHKPQLRFHKPKKDLCGTCFKYEKVLQGEEKEAFRAQYEEHRERNEAGMEEKRRDKKSCENDPSKMVVSMDLQKVLTTPSLEVGLLFYKRKLNVLNFTIMESAHNKNGYCFVWPEHEAKRGANETGSCMLHYLENLLPKEVKHLIVYSDTCAGQNRNNQFSAMLLHAAKKTGIIIEQKFLESGHTHMEVDSMHAAIEFAKKHKKIYVEHQWHDVMVDARRRKPYIVVPITHKDIYDTKDLSSKLIKNRTKSMTKATVQWLKIKVSEE